MIAAPPAQSPVTTDMRLELYHMPGSCSRIVINALEELGLSYEDQVIDLLRGEHDQPGYAHINPRRKLPALRIDGEVLTETLAILGFLQHLAPSVRLMPQAATSLERMRQAAELSWCASSLQPLVSSLRSPQRWTDADPEPVAAKGRARLAPVIDEIDARLERRAWWFGDVWSIVDVYLAWVTGTAAGAGLDLSGRHHLLDHQARVRKRASFVRALARETQSLRRSGLSLPQGAHL